MGYQAAEDHAAVVDLLHAVELRLLQVACSHDCCALCGRMQPRCQQ